MDRAFDRLDLNKNGIVEISDIKGLYNPSKHPAVLEGRKTEDQVLQEFLETFELHHNMKSGQEKDGKVTRDEFREYYANVSVSIDNDEYFEVMINNSWNLTGKAATYVKQAKPWTSEVGRQVPVQHSGMESSGSPLSGKKKGAGIFAEAAETKAVEDIKGIYKFNEESKKSPFTPAKSTYEPQPLEGITEKKPSDTGAKMRFGNTVATDFPKYQNIMLERFRTKLVGRGGKGIVGLERQFKIFDLDGSGELSREEFKKAINDFKLGMDERDLDNLFKMFDKNMDGKISYEEFMGTLIGFMSEFRLNLVHRAFESLDEDEDEVVDLGVICKSYSAKMHPDIKSGKKTEEEVVNEFITSFEIHHNNFGAADSNVTKTEFVAYYNKLSAAIENDAYFDTLLSNAWGLGLRSNSEKQPYAGAISKIYQVDSKSRWNYDHHKTLYSMEHPMKPGEEGQRGESRGPKSIYEMGEGMKPAGAPSFPKVKGEKSEAEVKKGYAVGEQKYRLSDMEILKFVVDKLHARGARGVIGIRRKFAVSLQV